MKVPVSDKVERKKEGPGSRDIREGYSGVGCVWVDNVIYCNMWTIMLSLHLFHVRHGMSSRPLGCIERHFLKKRKREREEEEAYEEEEEVR